MSSLADDCMHVVDDDGIYEPATIKDLITEIVRLRRDLQTAKAEWYAWRDVANLRPSVQCSCGARLKSTDEAHPCNKSRSE